MQAGIIFGLPKEQAMIGEMLPSTRRLKAPSNITVTYTTSADWIQLEPKDQQLRVIVAENTTGRPRTGWIIAKGVGLVDSLQVTQVDLADIVGQYTQHSMTLDAATGTMVPLSSDVEIKKVSDTQAQFIIDGHLHMGGCIHAWSRPGAPQREGGEDGDRPSQRQEHLHHERPRCR